MTTPNTGGEKYREEFGKARKELRKCLVENVAELEAHEESMDAVSFQYEHGVLITGNQAKLILELLSRPPRPEGGVRERVKYQLNWWRMANNPSEKTKTTIECLEWFLSLLPPQEGKEE